MGFLSKLLTMGEGKQLKRYQAKVDKINALEPEFQALTDEQLAAKTSEFRERYAAGESLDDLLPEAFAAVREASVRTIGLRHFDVQLIGGMALNEGQIAEMKTGEGKTLVSTLAGYLNAIPGHNVHIVTVNDYLARRDCEWMGRIYRFLGMKTGLIQNGMAPAAKKPAYEADITYGTNSEFGFDYLRDNMVTRGASRVQRGHHFAIVDEVDSILIDEARTPLIISGAGTQAADTYKKFARVMPGLQKGVDFDMDEAKRTINATESGLEKIEAMLGIDNIYADPSGQLANHLQQALKAQFLFHRDVDYVVMDGEVKIVDEFTGRIMEGRRYSEGLHQALEAKERVIVREENQTLATITLQNYFRLYDKLSGMTGTAMTEDAEFRQIYKLPVMAIPPNRPVIRKDENDLVYRTVDGKFNAVADDIAARHAAGQPCLIGTVSIENSEKLSRLLDKRGIPHETLNAKHHEREAHIVAQAGRAGAVTIATNMAGRGTDIRLGGDPEVLAEDMLRQRGFNPDAVPGDEEEAGRVPTAEDRAAALAEAEAICDEEQQRVRAAGGKAIYEERNAILDGKSMTERIPGIIRDAVDSIVAECCPDRTASDDWDMKAIDLWAANMTGCNDFVVEKVDHEDDPEAVAEALYEFLDWIYEQKADQLGPYLMGNLSAQVMLRIIDTRWMAHLQEMDYLKTGIGLRAFGQRDPLVEYKNEAYNAFQSLTASMYDDYLRTLLRLEIAAKPTAGAGKGAPAASPLEDADDPLERKMSYSSPEEALASSGVRGRHAAANMPGQPPKPAPAKPQTFVKDKEDPYANVGRNDPCPCGSGKKFKKCHGQNL